MADHSGVDVSIVVPVHNGGALLSRQLLALAGQDFAGRYEVVVVNNRSTDDSLTVSTAFAERDPVFRVFDAPRATSISDATNIGVRAAFADLILTTDQDDLVCREWITQMCSGLESFSIVSGATLLQPEPLDANQFANPEFPSSLLVHGDFLPFAMNCNMGFTRELFGQINGFDRRMDQAQDVDFCWRAQLRGHELGFVRDAKLLKSMRTSNRGKFKQHRGYGAADVDLERRFRVSGYTGLRRRAAKQAAWLVARAPHAALRPDQRSEWAAVAGRVSGVASASLRGVITEERG